jgi:hypothetical protein
MNFLTTRQTVNLLVEDTSVLTVLRLPSGRYPQIRMTVIAKDYTPYPGDTFQHGGRMYRVVTDP